MPFYSYVALPISWQKHASAIEWMNVKREIISIVDDDDDDDDDDDGIQQQEQKDFLLLIVLLFLCRFLYLFASW